MSLLRSVRLQAAVVCVVSVLVHAGALRNGLVYDDVALVLENPWIRSSGELPEAFRQALFAFDPEASERDPGSRYYRPLVHVGLWLLRAVFGTSPAGYHAGLLLLHALVSVLVLGLLRELLVRGREQAPREASAACLGAALLFAVHPVHTEAVAWVSGCMDVGATLSVLLVIWLLRAPAPSAGRLLAAAAVWLAGLLVKETALVMPVLLWATLRAGPGAPRLEGRHALLGLGLLPYLVLRGLALGATVPGASGPQQQDGWIPETLAVLGRLGAKLLWPVDLQVLPSFPRGGATFTDPWVLAGLALVLVLFTAVVLSFRSAPRVFAGLMWLVVPMLPVAFVQLRGMDAYAERYLYLPSVGLVLLVALALQRLLAAARGTAWLATAALLLLLVLGAWGTRERVAVWRSDQTLWEDAVRRFPHNPWGHARLGTVYLRARRPAEAVAHLEQAARGLPLNAKLHTDLGIALAMGGRTEQAIAHLQRAHRLAPDSASVHHNLGLALRRAGRLEEAARAFTEVARRAPTRADTQLELGRTLLQLGRPAEAIPALEAALRLEPGLKPAARALGAARKALHAPPVPQPLP